MLGANLERSSEVPEETLPVLSGNKPLSHRERQVLALLLKGKQNKVIASELRMQEGTVKVHLRSVMRKLGVRNRLEIVLATLRQTPSAASDRPKGIRTGAVDSDSRTGRGSLSIED
jgi:DNA-binding NarL/FixJ family response regulator